MCECLPEHIDYWITSSSKHDCFFIVGQKPGRVERIGAIKILLIGHSEVFRNMLDESALAETGDISITDTDPDTFRNFLKCVYGGSKIVLLDLSFEECMKILYLCDKYLVLEVKSKVSSCILNLHKPLTAQNVLIALSNPASLNDKNIESEVSRIAQHKTETILSNIHFLNLDYNALIFIAKQDRLSISEASLWRAFLVWAKNNICRSTGGTVARYSGLDLRLSLGKLLKLIRFCTMKSQEFCAYVVPSAVLTPEEVFEICKSIGTNTTPALKSLSNSMVSRAKKPSAEVMFYYVLNNVGEFTGEEDSRKVVSNNFQWYINIEKLSNDEESTLAVFLYCEPVSSETANWTCDALVEITLVNRFTKNNLVFPFSYSFSERHCNQGFFDFVSWNVLVEPKNGFLKNNSFLIMVKVEFDSK